MNQKIMVLIVEDSAFARPAIQAKLESDTEIEIVEQARCPWGNRSR
jgi:chemotaxis response regulator CheB